MAETRVYASDRLGTDPLAKLIRELAMPGIVAQVINMLYNVVDRIYIARIPEVGSMALSGLGIVMPLLMVFGAFSAFTTAGGAPLASIALGAGDQKRAEKLLSTNATLMAILGFLMTTLGLIYKRPLIHFFGGTEANFIYADEYLSIYLLGTVFVLGTLGLNSFISAQGEAKIAMRTILIGAISNIILDPIFIFALNMGVKGAALATIISQFISFMSVLLFLISPQSKLRLRGLSFDIKLVWESVKLGIAGFVMSSTQSAVVTVFNRLLALHGGDLHVAAMVVLQSIMQMIFIPMNGYVMGVQPLLSYNYGAKQYDRVNRIIRISAILLVSFAATISILSILFPGAFAFIFTNDPALTLLVRQYLPIFIAGSTIFGMQMVAQMYFVGSNQPGFAIFLASLRKIILLIPFCFLFAAWWGVVGIYAAEAVADALSAITSGLLLVWHVKRMKKYRDEQEAELNA